MFMRFFYFKWNIAPNSWLWNEFVFEKSKWWGTQVLALVIGHLEPQLFDISSVCNFFVGIFFFIGFSWALCLPLINKSSKDLSKLQYFGWFDDFNHLIFQNKKYVMYAKNATWVYFPFSDIIILHLLTLFESVALLFNLRDQEVLF